MHKTLKPASYDLSYVLYDLMKNKQFIEHCINSMIKIPGITANTKLLKLNYEINSIIICNQIVSTQESL